MWWVVRGVRGKRCTIAALVTAITKCHNLLRPPLPPPAAATVLSTGQQTNQPTNPPLCKRDSSPLAPAYPVIIATLTLAGKVFLPVPRLSAPLVFVCTERFRWEFEPGNLIRLLHCITTCWLADDHHKVTDIKFFKRLPEYLTVWLNWLVLGIHSSPHPPPPPGTVFRRKFYWHSNAKNYHHRPCGIFFWLSLGWLSP